PERAAGDCVAIHGHEHRGDHEPQSRDWKQVVQQREQAPAHQCGRARWGRASGRVDGVFHWAGMIGLHCPHAGDACRPPPQADATLIDAFADAAWAEQGLARRTLENYRADLAGFARWRNRADGGLATADRAALFDYLAMRGGAGYSARSNARLLTALRTFFAWQVRRR